MPQNKLFARFLYSGMQAIAVQVLGSLFFYLISVYLSKDNFGMISWLNALSLFFTTILGFGLEQVVTRRIAASNRSDWAAGAFFIHSVAGFIITLLILLGLKVIFHDAVFQYLPWFFAAQGLIFTGVPLKQFLNAKERFTPYGVIALISNSFKILVAWYLQYKGLLNTGTVITVLIGSAALELLCLLAYVVPKTTFSFKFNAKPYIKLIRESAAQYISVIFDMSLSRIDWILLGIITTNVVLADYSFAYRAFELARLPMLIIGPMILPRFSRLLATTKRWDDFKDWINDFNTVELFFAMLIPLILNFLWTPVVGWITGGKYGQGNSLQFMLLSLCIPLQFFVNLLWTVGFSAKKYRSVTGITIACAVTNIALNLLLIPMFDSLGAAIAFLATTALQGFLYYRLVNREVVAVSIFPLVAFILLAGIVYIAVNWLSIHYIFRLIIAIAAYLFIAAGCKLITKQRMVNFKNFLS
ncbi:oligosaccharide flippase family protein [Mucilaginibacter mali]|uniref:Oligosaccharide flippase family protein n=1 Tax=Mucilaginibacter mali TaxID=2740462 RepID=A0A7D4PTE5_9SPHI|nr:oligosaccharide flippase family protein [Mucilaginibacter mali]QKJ29928.1 oligosaccharide flippase family protein [Mucilaginibacter mali]